MSQGQIFCHLPCVHTGMLIEYLPLGHSRNLNCLLFLNVSRIFVTKYMASIYKQLLMLAFGSLCGGQRPPNFCSVWGLPPGGWGTNRHTDVQTDKHFIIIYEYDKPSM